MKKRILNFYKDNYKFFMIALTYTIAVWTYSSIFAMVLAKYYNFSETILSYSISLFPIAFLIGSSYINIRLEHRINYFSFMIKVIMILLFTNILTGISAYYHIIPTFYIARIIEGFASGILASMFGHITSYLFSETKYKTTKSSIYTSLIYVIKTTIPMIVSTFLIIKNFEISIFFVSSIAYSTLILTILLLRKKIFYKYQRIILKSQFLDKKKKSFFNTMKDMIMFFSNGLAIKDKIYFSLIVALQNSLRPFYDLYFGLLLINSYHFSLAKSVSLISFMVLGQSSQLFVEYFREYIKLYIFRLIELLLFLIPVILIYNGKIFEYNYIFLAITFYILGLSRSAYAVYEFNLNMNLIKKKVKINRIAFFRTLIGEGSHFLSYFVFGIFLYYGFTLKEIFIYPLIITIILLFIWIIYDLKEKIN